MIKGLILTPLRIVEVPKGNVLHAIKRGDLGDNGFGEVYFSNVYCKSIKAWKRHHQMVLNIVVPVGIIRFVLFDDREGSSSYGEFQQIVLSQENYQRLTIPPWVWVGFQGLGEGTNLLMNFADMIHDPLEADKKEISGMNFDWGVE